MRRYTVEVTARVRIRDENGHTVASRSVEKSVAVDICGKERDLIVGEGIGEAGDDMTNEMTIFAQNTLQGIKRILDEEKKKK